MSDRTWEDIGNEIRDDYLRDGGPENVRFREVQWEVWIAEVERAAAARALAEIAKDSAALEEAARDGMNSRGGPYPWNAAKGVRDMLHARAAEIREGKNDE